MHCVISGQFLRQKDKQKCITCLESRDSKSHKRRQCSSTWPTQRLEYLPTLTTYIMVHSVGAHAWQQSPWRLPLWINHLLSYQNILCMQTQHRGIKAVCLQATTNLTLNISKTQQSSSNQCCTHGHILHWRWWLIWSKCTDGWMFPFDEPKSCCEDHVVC